MRPFLLGCVISVVLSPFANAQTAKRLPDGSAVQSSSSIDFRTFAVKKGMPKTLVLTKLADSFDLRKLGDSGGTWEVWGVQEKGNIYRSVGIVAFDANDRLVSAERDWAATVSPDAFHLGDQLCTLVEQFANKEYKDAAVIGYTLRKADSTTRIIEIMFGETGIRVSVSEDTMAGATERRVIVKEVFALEPVSARK